MKSNFSFLDEKWPLLGSLGNTAEKYLYTDSNSCLIKLGVFAESIVQLMFTLDKIEEPQEDNTHANRIKVLIREGLIPKDIEDILYAIRISRNDAVHNSYESTEKAKILLEFAYKLSTWFMQTYGDWNYIPFEFVMPEDTSRDMVHKGDIDVLEEKINQLAVIKTSNSNRTNVSIADRRIRANSTGNQNNLSEKEKLYDQVSPELGDNKIKIGAFVRNTMDKLVQEDAMDEDMVALLCSKNYCKQTFDLNYPFLKRLEKGISLSEQRKIKGHDRYWAQEVKIRINTLCAMTGMKGIGFHL
ncbi:MAG: DUF4145 domain-containing protein [Desulfitobacteriaceae bacterium]